MSNNPLDPTSPSSAGNTMPPPQNDLPPQGELTAVDWIICILC